MKKTWMLAFLAFRSLTGNYNAREMKQDTEACQRILAKAQYNAIESNHSMA